MLTLWGIWEARNKWLFENVKMVASHVVERIEGLFQSFVCMQSISKDSEQSNRDISVERWEVPPVGWYKLNVDVAVDKVNGKNSNPPCWGNSYILLFYNEHISP